MDCTNTDVFSPIRNFDAEKNNRQSDGFSEFLKGPDIFKKKSVNSEALENVDENTPIFNISNIKSSKTHQKKTAKYEIYKSEKESASSTSIHDSALTIAPKKSSSLKKDRSKNISLTSKRNDKLRTNQQSDAECNNKKKYDSHSAKKNSINLVKSSLQSGAASVPIASGSKEIKKANEPSSVSKHNPLSRVKEIKKANEPSSVSKHNPLSQVKEIKKANEPSSVSKHNPLSQVKEIKKANEPSSVRKHNPLSQIKSGVLEKIINDAVESQADDIRQLLWSHHLNSLKAISNIQDEMEQRRAENTTMFKIVEQLLEENRLLRNALLTRG